MELEHLKALEIITEGIPLQDLNKLIENKEKYSDELLQIVDYTVDNAVRLSVEESYVLHIIAMYALAYYRDKRAYPAIMSMAKLPKRVINPLLEDTITEGLSSIIASVFDGDQKTIKNIIENPKCDSFVRTAALDSLVTLVANGVIDRDEVVHYFKVLYNHKIHLLNDGVIEGLIHVTLNIHPQGLEEEFIKANDEDVLGYYSPEWDSMLQEQCSKSIECVLEESKKYSENRLVSKDDVLNLSKWLGKMGSSSKTDMYNNGEFNPIEHEFGYDDENPNWEFFEFLKIEQAGNLDGVVQALHNELFNDYDCIACSNCCKEISPVLTKEDIGRLSKKFDLKPKAFIKKYLAKAKGEYVTSGQPCIFLTESGCSIYDERPKNCMEFPYADKEDVIARLYTLMENCSICPVALDLIKRLKEHYKNEFSLYNKDSDEYEYEDDYDEDMWVSFHMEYGQKGPEEIYPFLLKIIEQDNTDDFLNGIGIVDILADCFKQCTDTKEYDNMLHLYRFFIEKYPNYCPEEIAVLDVYVLEYGLYTGDIALLNSCFERYKKYPELSCELLTKLYEKMLYYGYLKEAKSICKEVYPYTHKVRASFDRLDKEYSHWYLMIRMQEVYLKLKKDQEVDIDILDEELISFGNDLSEKIFEIEGYLSCDREELKNHVLEEWNSGSNEIWEYLVWFFARWMHDEKGIGFPASTGIWYGIKSFMSSSYLTNLQGNSEDFMLNPTEYKRYNRSCLERDSKQNTYAVCLIWGTPYVYDFLYELGMVDDSVYMKAMDIVKENKLIMIERYFDELWQFNYVHSWTLPKLPEVCGFPEEKKLFEESFIQTPVLENYIPLEYVAKIHNQEAAIAYDTFFPQMPIQRSTPKVGRNGPCPCGSGKKYKKCCEQ